MAIDHDPRSRSNFNSWYVKGDRRRKSDRNLIPTSENWRATTWNTGRNKSQKADRLWSKATKFMLPRSKL